MKISIVVPIVNTNDARIEKTLQNILNQSVESIEVLCVYCGSPSSNHIEPLTSRDCRVNVISQHGGGLGELLNCGIDHAQGDYILFLDAKVALGEGALGKMLESATAEDADVVALRDVESELAKVKEYGVMAHVGGLLWGGYKIYRRLFLKDNHLRFMDEGDFLRGERIKDCVVSYVEEELFDGDWGTIAPHERFYYALTALYSNISQGGVCDEQSRLIFANYCIGLSKQLIPKIVDKDQRKAALELLYKLDRTHKLRDYEKVNRSDTDIFYFDKEYRPWLYEMVMEHITTPRHPALVNPTKEGISIIIPVYNVEAYVELSLRSVMNQSYDGDIQIICINDGSTDRSLEVLRRLAQEDSRIEIIDQPNAGQGPARNAGLKIARHERIMFLDSDDFLELDAFDLVATAFGYDTDLIIFSYKGFGCSDCYAERPTQEGLLPLTDEMRTTTNLTVWNKVWRRSIIERYNIEFPAIKYEDTVFLAIYFIVAKSAFYFTDKLFSYRLREDSTMGLSRKKNYPHVGDFLISVDILYDKLLSMNLLNVGAAVFSRIFKMQIHGYVGHTKGRKQREGYKIAKRMLHRYEQQVKLRDHNFDSYIDKIENGNIHAGELRKYYILRFLLILTTTQNSNSKRYLLFGKLPLYKIKESGGVTRHYLLGFIPLFKCKPLSH